MTKPLFYLFVALSIADALLTAWGVGTGRASEANPLMAWINEAGGPAALIAPLLGIKAIAVLAIYTCLKRAGGWHTDAVAGIVVMAAVNLLMVWVVVHNLGELKWI